MKLFKLNYLMRNVLITLFSVSALALSMSAHADSSPFPTDATFTTLINVDTARNEGITGDDQGFLYITEEFFSFQRPMQCKVLRVDPDAVTPTFVTVGIVEDPCAPLGMAFGPDGKLYIAAPATDSVVRLTPDAASPPVAEVYAVITSTVGNPNPNGIAFDAAGNLWVSDQNTGEVFRIPADHTPGDPISTDTFRVPTRFNNEGVGLGMFPEPDDLSPGAPLGFSANGIVINKAGDLIVADTDRGALWKVKVAADGTVLSPTGGDTTYPPSTLDMSNVWVQHPQLAGMDGIALDRAGNVWAPVNFRNALVVVTSSQREVIEIFRNPVQSNNRRSGGVTAAEQAMDNRILEGPSSIHISGKRLCVTNIDFSLQDNFPGDLGEIFNIDVGIPLPVQGKISCLDQELKIPGARLPVGPQTWKHFD